MPGGSGNGILTGGRRALPCPTCDATDARLSVGLNLQTSRRARRCKYVEPVTTYACDVLLPTGLYGPLYIWLLRKGREQLVYRTLLALRIVD